MFLDLYRIHTRKSPGTIIGWNSLNCTRISDRISEAMVMRQFHQIRLRFAAFLIVAFVGTAGALYAEQVGKYDWLRQHVGPITHAHIRSSVIFVASSPSAPSPSPPSSLSSSTSASASYGVVAALSASNGEVLWRVVLDEEETIEALEESDGIVAVLTSAGRVRAFQGKDGRQLWETKMPTDFLCTFISKTRCCGCKMIIMAPESLPAKASLVVAGGGKMGAFSLTSGRHLWTVSLIEEGSLEVVALKSSYISNSVDEKDPAITVLMSDKTQKLLQVANVDLGTGALHGQISTQASLPTSHAAALLPDAVAFISDEHRGICVLRTESAVGKPLCSPIADFVPAEVVESLQYESLKFSAADCGAFLHLQAGNEGTALIRVTDSTSKGIEALGWYSHSFISDCHDGKVAVVGPWNPSSTSTRSGDTQHAVNIVKVINDKQAVLYENSDPFLSRYDVFGELIAVTRIHSSAKGHALVQFEDDAVLFVPHPDFIKADHKSSSLNLRRWTRYESLASVIDVIFADLPAPTPENQAEWMASQPSMKDRLRIELLALKSQAGFARPEEKRIIEKFRSATSERLRPTRDPDGFRRQIIVLTGTGKVASLHTGDGRLLWSTDFGQDGGAHRIAAWKKPHDVYEDELIVVFRIFDTEVIGSVLNTRTGALEIEERVRVDDRPDAVDIIPIAKPHYDDAAEQSLYAVLSGGKVRALWPNKAATKRSAESQIPDMVRWKVSQDGRSITGFKYDENLKEFEVWRVHVAEASEIDGSTSDVGILAMAAMDPSEIVYSAARPTASGGILLKHINPNTLLIVTGPTCKQGHGHRLVRRDDVLVATLIDAATGSVLTSQRHSRATGPVHAIVSEHWAAYHFWSLEHDRWQISVIDAYRPVPLGLSTTDLAFGGKSSPQIKQLNTSDLRDLAFERQSFLTRLGADDLSVTKTAHGTAAKMLLIATPGGQIAQVDRRLLDPRRPVLPSGVKPSRAQAAEGLPPYQPEIILAGPSFATLRHRVMKLRKIITSPAVLESASLMFGVGLDLFYARLQPSKGFDMVPDDFPHALLVAMVMGMAGALLVLKAILQQRALKLKWQ